MPYRTLAGPSGQCVSGVMSDDARGSVKAYQRRTDFYRGEGFKSALPSRFPRFCGHFAVTQTNLTPSAHTA